MYNVSMRMLGIKEDAEDVVQDSFVDAFRNLKSFRYESTFGSWLKRIVIPAHVNETSDFLPSWSILKEVEQEHIWKYDRDELKDVVAQMEAVD